MRNTLLFFFMICPTLAAASMPTLKYDIGGSNAWIPYYVVDKNNPGIIGELVPLILEKAKIKGITIDFPTNRTNQALVKGELDFDVASPSWFEQGKFPEQFVMSHPIMEITENYVFLRKNRHQWVNLKQLEKHPIGTVRGYIYHDQDKFKRMDFLSERELIDALAKERVTAIISGNYPAIYWSKKLGVDIEIGPVHSSGMLHFRLQKKFEHLLPQLNEAISSLITDGTIESTVRKYTAAIVPSR